MAFVDKLALLLHGHSHEAYDSPGDFAARETRRLPSYRDFRQRAFTVGIGGPVGTGKTALLKALCERLRNEFELSVVTNDIFTREDAEFLIRHSALTPERIVGVETGGCPHAAIREDISVNMDALEGLMAKFPALDFLFVESGGDNLAAHFSRELVDYSIYVIDVSGGDKIPRKGGPGITQSDLLIINKIDLKDLIRADLGVMERDSKRMRGEGPFLFARALDGFGLDEVIGHIHAAKARALAAVSPERRPERGHLTP